MPTILNIDIGSPEWLVLRREHITSTDASIINGTNTFGGNSPRKLWERKLDLLPPEYVNAAMIEGVELESHARNWYNDKFNTDYEPEICVHDTHYWAMATLDGYYEDSIMEIKCGKKSFEQAQAGLLPPYYFDQIQHAMFCRGVRKAIYIAYRPDKEPVVMHLEADDEYMRALLEKESDFYFNNLVALVPPDNAGNDFEIVEDEEKIALADERSKTKIVLDEAKRMEKEAKERLLTGLEQRKWLCGNVRIGYTVKRGDIDWKIVSEKFSLSEQDLDSCRKKSSSFFNLRIV